MNAGQFRKYLIKAYEGEVRGCAYFEGLAAYFDDPRQRRLLQHLAEIESSTAAWLAPVLKRYGLEARRDATSTALGVEAALADGEKSWEELVTHFCHDYPPYIEQFEAMQAAGAELDQPALQALTEHEIAIVEFAQRELAGVPNSEKPVEELLKSWGSSQR